MALVTALENARDARANLVSAQERERWLVVAFMDEALRHYWSWERIGESLGVSGTGARRYYVRNRRHVRSV